MTKLFPYQQQGVKQIDRFAGRALLADEMGLGKSIQSLTWIKRYRHSRQTMPTVIVCPASLKWNWEAEALKHINMQATVLEGTKLPRRSISIRRQPLIIINYDILKVWLPILKKMKLRTVIADEIHYCKSRSTQRSKALTELCKDVPYVLGLSGTPLTNRPAELWQAMHLIRPDIYKSFWKFANRHCRPHKTFWGWEYKGAERLGELHRTSKKNLMIRRLKKDVLKDLPGKSRHVFPIRIEPEAYKEYREASDDFIRWLTKLNPAKVSSAARAERLVQMGYLKRLSAKLKLKSVMDWVDNFLLESDGKLSLFGIHKFVLKALHERYSNQSVVVSGSVVSRKRQDAVTAFQTQKKCRLFLGNIRAAGVGLNLTAASTMGCVEMGWTPGEHTQVEDRHHRIGTRSHVSCLYFVALQTIEEPLCELIQTKQLILDEILDGKPQGASLDIFSQLHKELINGSGQARQ